VKIAVKPAEAAIRLLDNSAFEVALGQQQRHSFLAQLLLPVMRVVLCKFQ
jgi:hypothetical protein